jgi:hypothetical protein
MGLMIQRRYPEEEQLRKLEILRDVYFKTDPITSDSFLFNCWLEFCIFHLCPILEEKYNTYISITRQMIEEQGCLVNRLYDIHCKYTKI